MPTSKAGAEAVVSRIAKKGGKATAVQGDVAKVAEIERLFQETKSAYGKLDILVNNAGVYEFAAAGTDHAGAHPEAPQPQRGRTAADDEGSGQANGAWKADRLWISVR